jgi:ubiquinone/menaquinone biosynthesis C-methylase UbiE
MTDGKAAARRRFDRWASRYENDRRSRANASVQSAALHALALRPGDRFLDVGCGSGAAVRAASETVGHAVGVDLAPAMIERARQLAAGLAGVEFVVGDSEQLPLPDASFTAVLCSSSFHHYPNPGRALEEMGRVLTPGGRLVVADPNGDLRVVRIADKVLRRLDAGHVRLYRSGELEMLAGNAGFINITTTPLERGYVLLRARRPPAPG